MVDAVVDSGELLRRIQRARADARQELRTWQEREEETGPDDAYGTSEARVRALAYEAVLRVLDEILTPGRHGPEPPESETGHATGLWLRQISVNGLRFIHTW